MGTWEVTLTRMSCDILKWGIMFLRRGRLCDMAVVLLCRSHDEVEKEDALSPSPVKQKNKKRCFKCSCKLELAQREIGRCRCGK